MHGSLRITKAAIAVVAVLAITVRADDQRDSAKETALFARDNLVAWCIVPFDAKKRGPEERAAMLARLGVKRLAYDYRAEHVPTFDEEIAALGRHNIRLDAWWFPTTLKDESRLILEVLKRHKIRTQLWVSGGGAATANAEEQQKRVEAEADRIQPIAEAAAAIGCQVGLYNHGGWFGEPENQIAVIDRLKLANVGIVYNLHHGHDHIDRLPDLLKKMRPHLLAVNINGMVRGGDRDGRKILPLGAGELDLAVLRAIRNSGYRGPIGILNHTDHDAEARLADNLDGLDWLVAQLDGKAASPKTKYRTHEAPAATQLVSLGPAKADPNAPRLLDDLFSISLFAENPQIVTPVGMTVDARGRLLVLENHTHFPPKGYSLHTSDRIRSFEDTDGDGRADRIATFFDGLRHALHLTTDRDGSILVATRSALYRLYDKDGDGRAERSDTLLRLETKCDYPHNGLFSAAVDYNGDLLVSMGENLGEAYRLIGTDGKMVTGGGEGGNIFRCRHDGSGVEKIATGFWNPVQLRFDPFGRLLTIDNDPDSRPPCRLLHIVDGGDYGFRYRNGRKGLHPFTAWNGELPGTLPMMSGTAEAPSGLLLCEAGFFPDDYRGSILVTSWGDHRVECFRPVRRGASWGAEVKPLVVGGENFRPVAIFAAPDDSIYLTDWVDKSYELHGKGRIWRIRVNAKPAVATSAANPRARAAAIQSLAAGEIDEALSAKLLADASSDIRHLAVRMARSSATDWAEFARKEDSLEVRAAAIRRIDLSRSSSIPPVVMDAIGSEDPFLRTAAIDVLRRSPKTISQIDPTKLAHSRQQCGVLLAQRRAGIPPDARQLRELFKSADPDLLFVVVEWIGEARLKDFRADLESLLVRSDVTSEIAASAMAALALLDGQRPDQADQIGSHFYMAKLLVSTTSPPAIKARALRGLPSHHETITSGRLGDLLTSDDSRVRVEAVRTLRETTHSDRAAKLMRIADDVKQSIDLRAEAVMGLSSEDQPQRELLWKLAFNDDDKNDIVRHEALRTLRGASLKDDQRTALITLAHGNDEVAAQAGRVLATQPDVQSKIENPKSKIQGRPDLTDIDAWMKLLDGPADRAAGERVFFHSKSAGCYRCHRVDGRGAEVGPDLTLIDRSFDRRRIVESILQPAKDIAPQFFAWQIRTVDGLTLTGMLVEEHVNGDQTYVDAEGKRTTLALRDVAERRAVRTSIMPDRLVDTLTLQEFRDLVAYLTTTGAN